MEQSPSARPSRLAAPRHKWPDRLFHWCMAVSVLILLFSAFLPIAGLEFDWIPWHWVAGVFLTLLIVLHIVRALFFQSLSHMIHSDAKYDIFQKGYHWITAFSVLVLIASGLPMLIKLDTLFWNRNPSILSDIQWGYVYVAHGLAALLLIFLVILHIYFALLPEHKELLKSMISGRQSSSADH